MPLSPDNYLRALSDEFTPVRDSFGRLLGCVPRVAENAVSVGHFPLMLAVQVCVFVRPDDAASPPLSTLPGFIPLAHSPPAPDDALDDAPPAAPKGVKRNATIR